MVPQSREIESDCSPVFADVGDKNAVVIDLVGADGKWEVGNKVEEAACEDFRREFIDRAGRIYRRSEPNHNVRKSPFDESKLKRRQKPIRQQSVVPLYLVRVLLLATYNLLVLVNLGV